MSVTRQALRKILFRISESITPPVERKKLKRQLKRAYLNFGSETPDNTEALNHIEFGRIRQDSFFPWHLYGLKIKKSNTAVSDILGLCETDEVVDFIRKDRPDLTEQEIFAALRVATLTLLALEVDA